MAADMDVKQRFFPHTQDELKEIASGFLRHAKDLGATDAATGPWEGDGLSVSGRRGEVETIEHNRRDKMVGADGFHRKEAQATRARPGFFARGASGYRRRWRPTSRASLREQAAGMRG